MEKIALKVGGTIFVLVAILHVVRVVMKLPVTIGSMEVSLGASILGAVIAFLPGLWMLKIACGCCCSSRK